MRRQMSSLPMLLALTIITLLPTHSSAQAAADREPVIVIPGMAGSEFTAASAFQLNVDDGHGGVFARDYAAGEKVWVNVFQAALPGDDDYFDALKLQPDGATPVAPELQVGDIYHSTYDDLIGYLQREGYTLGRDLWLFPYDWRRDIRATAERLDGLVTAALVTANGNRADPQTWTIRHVDIVAHSMGGVVGRFYVSDPPRARRVDQLITLGSPQLGAAKFLKTLLYGDDFGSTFLGLGLNPDEVKDVLRNMPGGMELLPSRSYYTFYDNHDEEHLRPFLEERDADGDGVAAGALPYDIVRRLLLNLGTNSAVLSMAESFQGQFDGLRVFLPLVQSNGPPALPDEPGGGVRWQALIGFGHATLGQVREYTGVCGDTLCPRREELPIDGDGTVGLYSAAMGDPARGRLFTSATQRWYVERSHSGLVQRDYVLGLPAADGPALQWIGERLRQSGARAGPSTSAFATAAPSSKLGGVWVAALGPVAMRISDAEGQAMGRLRGDQALPATIPDASYDRLPDGEFGYLKRDKPYTVFLDAERAGSVDLKIRVLNQGHVKHTAVYLGVRLGAAGHARLALPALAGNLTQLDWPELELDADGDGAFELAQPPSAVLDERVSGDITPPAIMADVSKIDAAASGGFAVRWGATDADAGLLREWAVIDPGSATARTIANGEIVALPPGPHHVLIIAVDRAGNARSREISITVISI